MGFIVIWMIYTSYDYGCTVLPLVSTSLPWKYPSIYFHLIIMGANPFIDNYHGCSTLPLIFCIIIIDVLYFHWFPPHYMDAYPSIDFCIIIMNVLPSIEFSIIIMGTYPSMKFTLNIMGAYHCIDFYSIIMDVKPFHWFLHHYDIPHYSEPL